MLSCMNIISSAASSSSRPPTPPPATAASARSTARRCSESRRMVLAVCVSVTIWSRFRQRMLVSGVGLGGSSVLCAGLAPGAADDSAVSAVLCAHAAQSMVAYDSTNFSAWHHPRPLWGEGFKKRIKKIRSPLISAPATRS